MKNALGIFSCLALYWFQSIMGQFDLGMEGDRRVIVQLFQWPFDDIRRECANVLGPQKFGGVLTAPITENAVRKVVVNGRTMRPWWEVYQVVSWDINSRHGTEQQFKQMVEECNKNNVRVYVDAVFNHGVGNVDGGDGEVLGVGGTYANAHTRKYPGLGYTAENFHKSCPMDWDDRTAVRICELAGLQDVNQTQPYVQDKIVAFLNKLIDYGVGGFRIDATKHMWPEDLRKIYNRLKDISFDNGKNFIRPPWMLENFDDDGDYQEDYKDVGSEYDFSFMKLLTPAIKSGSVNMSTIYNYVKSPTYLSKTKQDFGTNHDLQRWHWAKGFAESPAHTGIQQVINAFLLTFSREVPNIFSGYSFASTELDGGPPSDESDNIISPENCSHGWLCEHRHKPLQWLVKYFSNLVQDAPVESWWTNWPNGTPQQAAFTRGRDGFAVFNADTKAISHTFKVSLPPGVYCDLATGYYCHHHQMCMGVKGTTQRQVEVKEDGTVEVSLPGMVRPASSAGDNVVPSEPPYLAISTRSMIPPQGSETENELIGKIGWIVLGIAAVVFIVLVAWFLLRNSKSKRGIDIKE
ncbi:unnamed protein product [Bemisia tabaci]|uniref:Alpha-amylase n=1 Tax=Bemisia tabaci TaxID=7038 RepID=A0A9P0EXL5_BEMTA|nr:unnamed protein product [Bemisia tabaci]